MLDIRKRKSLTREKLLAGAIREFVAELRLVDVVDYVAFLRMEHHANLADIVASSAELTFKPGVLRYSGGGEIRLNWGTTPIVVLGMEFRHKGVTLHFRIELGASAGAVDITYVAFDEPVEDEAEAIAAALFDARLRPLAAEAQPH